MAEKDVGSRFSFATIFFGKGGVAIIAIVLLVLALIPPVTTVAAALSGGSAEISSRFDFLRARVFDRLVNSVVLAIMTTTIAALIGIPVAFLLQRREFFGRRIFGVLYLLPLLIPPHMHCVAWMRIWGNNGWLSNWIRSEGVNFDVRRGFFEIGGEATIYPGAACVMASAFWPLMTLFTSAGFAHVDPKLEEAALVGRGRRAATFGVTLPLVRSHIIAGLFVVFIFAVGSYPVSALMNTPTIMLEIWFPSNNVDTKTAAVVALPLVAVTLAALALCLYVTRSHFFGVVRPPSETPASLRPRSFAAFAVVSLILLVMAGWPAYSLLEKAGPPSTYRALFSTNVAQNIENSVIIAPISACLLAAGGLYLALSARLLGRYGWAVELAALLPFAFPPVVVGVGANLFWSRFPRDSFAENYIYDAPPIVVFAHFSLFLPFALRAVRSGLARIPNALVEAARIGGAGFGRTTAKVVLPIVYPAIAAALVLGLVFAIGELAAGIIVSPGNWQSAQERIYNMIHFARDEEVAALCIIMAALVLLPLTLYRLLFDRKVEVL